MTRTKQAKVKKTQSRRSSAKKQSNQIIKTKSSSIRSQLSDKLPILIDLIIYLSNEDRLEVMTSPNSYKALLPTMKSQFSLKFEDKGHTKLHTFCNTIIKNKRNITNCLQKTAIKLPFIDTTMYDRINQFVVVYFCKIQRKDTFTLKQAKLFIQTVLNNNISESILYNCLIYGCANKLFIPFNESSHSNATTNPSFIYNKKMKITFIKTNEMASETESFKHYIYNSQISQSDNKQLQSLICDIKHKYIKFCDDINSNTAIYGKLSVGPSGEIMLKTTKQLRDIKKRIEILNDEIKENKKLKYNNINNNKNLNDLFELSALDARINSATDELIKLRTDVNLSVIHYFNTYIEYKSDFANIKNGQIFATTFLEKQQSHTLYLIANHIIGSGSTSTVIDCNACYFTPNESFCKPMIAKVSKLCDNINDNKMLNEYKIIYELNEKKINNIPKLYTENGANALIKTCDNYILCFCKEDGNIPLNILIGSEYEFSKGIKDVILVQLLLTLEQAHEYVVHYDIKPENVVWNDKRKRLQVIDWAESRRIGSNNCNIKNTKNYIPGTPRYLSPEALLYNYVNKFSDVIAVGQMMFDIYLGKEYLQHEKSTFRNEKEFNVIINEMRNILNGINEFKHMTLWNKMVAFKYENRPTALQCAQAINNVNNMSVNNISNINNMNNKSNINNRNMSGLGNSTDRFR